MKKFIILTVLVLCGSAWGGAATVTTYAELATAVGASATPIHLNAATFTLEADVAIGYACTIDNVYTGDVTITGADAYDFILRDAAITVNGVDATHKIIFTHGKTANVYVTAANAITTITMFRCDFTANKSGASGAFYVEGANSYIVTATLTYCNAYSNSKDAFSLGSSASSVVETMNLIDCDAYTNGKVDGTLIQNQGVTAHKANQYINITRGHFYDNGGQGVKGVGGCQIYLDSAELYANGSYDIGGDDTGAGTVYAKNCLFHDTIALGYGVLAAGASASVVLDSCKFYSPTATAYSFVANQGGSVVVRNCTFNGATYCTDGAVNNTTTAGVTVVDHCTFYNCLMGFKSSKQSFVCTNNIFDTCGSSANTGAIRISSTVATTNWYTLNPRNGYNYFYNNLNNFTWYNGAEWINTTQAKSTDVEATVAPAFIDHTGFVLSDNSPCIGIGIPFLSGDKPFVGAVSPQAHGMLRGRTIFGKWYKAG